MNKKNLRTTTLKELKENMAGAILANDVEAIGFTTAIISAVEQQCSDTSKVKEIELYDREDGMLGIGLIFNEGITMADIVGKDKLDEYFKNHPKNKWRT